jgi:hypothetical protein
MQICSLGNGLSSRKLRFSMNLSGLEGQLAIIMMALLVPTSLSLQQPICIGTFRT